MKINTIFEVTNSNIISIFQYFRATLSFPIAFWMAASAASIYFSCKFSNYNFPFVAFHLCFSQYAPMKLRIQFRLNKVFTHTPFPTPSSSLSKATVTLSRCHTHIQIHACTMRQKEVHAAQGELKLDNRAAGPPQLPIPNASLPPPPFRCYPWAIWHTNVLQLKDNSTGLETGDNCRRRAHTEGLKK